MIIPNITFPLGREPNSTFDGFADMLNIFFIDLREREKERERICGSTYLNIHWLLLVCALTGDQTHTHGVSGRYSNQLSHVVSAIPNISEIHTNKCLRIL